MLKRMNLNTSQILLTILTVNSWNFARCPLQEDDRGNSPLQTEEDLNVLQMQCDQEKQRIILGDAPS